jgi:hypothetical protein
MPLWYPFHTPLVASDYYLVPSGCPCGTLFIHLWYLLITIWYLLVAPVVPFSYTFGTF